MRLTHDSWSHESLIWPCFGACLTSFQTAGFWTLKMPLDVVVNPSCWTAAQYHGAHATSFTASMPLRHDDSTAPRPCGAGSLCGLHSPLRSQRPPRVIQHVGWGRSTIRPAVYRRPRATPTVGMVPIATSDAAGKLGKLLTSMRWRISLSWVDVSWTFFRSSKLAQVCPLAHPQLCCCADSYSSRNVEVGSIRQEHGTAMAPQTWSSSRSLDTLPGASTPCTGAKCARPMSAFGGFGIFDIVWPWLARKESQ